jgi:DNA topoisomerase IA
LGKALVITEKPSVARDITRVLGGFAEHEGYFESEWKPRRDLTVPASTSCRRR